VHSRPNISGEIADALRQHIVTGELAPGERINEVHLAKALGVSRTPLREALSSLVAEGAIETKPRRGFFVTPLSREELEGVYPIRAILDPEALRLAGIPDRKKLEKLKRLNAGLEKERGADQRIRLDDQWHLELVSNCGNRVLLDLIEQFMRRTHRYEYAYMNERHHLETAIREHREILAALARGDLKGACKWLKQNMESAKEPLIAWLDARQE
jgi:DNA-binding GntR family transcriptional regulator